MQPLRPHSAGSGDLAGLSQVQVGCKDLNGVVCFRYNIEDYREAFRTLIGRSAVGKVGDPADM